MTPGKDRTADNDNSGDGTLLTGRPCPICGKPGLARWKPFCSRRCADVDLNRWLTGRYTVPVVEDDDGDGIAREGEGEPS